MILDVLISWSTDLSGINSRVYPWFEGNSEIPDIPDGTPQFDWWKPWVSSEFQQEKRKKQHLVSDSSTKNSAPLTNRKMTQTKMQDLHRFFKWRCLTWSHQLLAWAQVELIPPTPRERRRKSSTSLPRLGLKKICIIDRYVPIVSKDSRFLWDLTFLTIH